MKRALLVAFAVLVPASAQAVPINYDIVTGGGPGFQFSYIHAATNTLGMDPYYPSGTKLFSLTGQLSGDWTGGVFTVVGTSNLDAEGLVAWNLGEIWDLEITGGAIAVSGTVAQGSLDYTLYDTGGSVYSSGTFYFDPVDFGGAGPNAISTSDLALWGNNWDVSQLSRDDFVAGGGTALGIDLGGPGTLVPEPTGFLLFAIGALVTGAATRRARLR